MLQELLTHLGVENSIEKAEVVCGNIGDTANIIRRKIRSERRIILENVIANIAEEVRHSVDKNVDYPHLVNVVKALVDILATYIWGQDNMSSEAYEIFVRCLPGVIVGNIQQIEHDQAELNSADSIFGEPTPASQFLWGFAGMIPISNSSLLHLDDETMEMVEISDGLTETVPSGMENSQQQGAVLARVRQMQVNALASSDDGRSLDLTAGTRIDIVEHAGVNFARTWERPVSENELRLMDEKCGSLARNVLQWMSEIGVDDFKSKAEWVCYNSLIHADNICTKVRMSSVVDLEHVIHKIANEIKKALFDHIQSLHLQALVGAIVRYYAFRIWGEDNADCVSCKSFGNCLPGLVIQLIRPNEVSIELISKQLKYRRELTSLTNIFCLSPGPHLLRILPAPVEAASDLSRDDIFLEQIKELQARVADYETLRLNVTPSKPVVSSAEHIRVRITESTITMGNIALTYDKKLTLTDFGMFSCFY